MKVIALIPARYHSTRFPAKLMQILGNQPIIIHTMERVQKTQLFQEVYVVTDNDLIYQTVEKYGGKALKSKGNYESGTDRIAAAAQDISADIILNVQGDEPFINGDALQNVIALFKNDTEQKIALGSLMQPLSDQTLIQDPNCVKVIVDKDNYALYFSRYPIPYIQVSEPVFIPTYYRHIGVYAFRKEALIQFPKLPKSELEKAEKIECLRYLEAGMRIKMAITDTVGLAIDTQEDFEKARTYFDLKKV